MKIITLAFFLSVFFSFSESFPEEIRVSDWKVINFDGNGTALIGEAFKNLGVGQNLEAVKKFKVELGKIKLLKNSQNWCLFANSELDLTGETPLLKNGSLRLTVDEPMQFKIQSPVGNISLDGRDFLIVYYADRARLEVSSFDGKVWIKGIYREEEQQFEKNFKGGFQGLMEREGPAFDQMLQGKKVVRGDLLAVQLMSSEELESLKKTFMVENKKVVVVVKAKAKPGQICETPFAKLNECVWHLKTGKCVRERCYASGIWGDSTLLSDSQKSLCNKTDRVAPCDY